MQNAPWTSNLHFKRQCLFPVLYLTVCKSPHKLLSYYPWARGLSPSSSSGEFQKEKCWCIMDLRADGLGWGFGSHFHSLLRKEGFPRGSDSKESACNAGDLGSLPGSGRSPGGGHGTPLQYSGESHGQRSLAGYTSTLTLYI